jgi:hypothetical protein
MAVDVIAKNLLEGKTCENCGYCGRGEDGWFCRANKKKPEENTCMNWDSIETVEAQEAAKPIPVPASDPYNPPYAPNKPYAPWTTDKKEQFPWRRKKIDEDEIERKRITWEEENGDSKYKKYSNTLEKYMKKLHENLEYTQKEYDKYKDLL